MNRRQLLTSALALGTLTAQEKSSRQLPEKKKPAAKPGLKPFLFKAASPQLHADAHLFAMMILMFQPQYTSQFLDASLTYDDTIFAYYRLDKAIFATARQKIPANSDLLNKLNAVREAYRLIARQIVPGTNVPATGDPYPDDECPYGTVKDNAVKSLQPL